MPSARPTFTRPGQLLEAAIRDMWRLRTSIYPLKPEVDPEQDYAWFRRFAVDAHVGRMLGARGETLAMFGCQRIDVEHAGQRYRLGLFEYGYAVPKLRGDPLTAAMYAAVLLGARSLSRGVVSYFGGIGYPRSVLVISQVVSDLRLDGDPSFTAIERMLIDMVIERQAGSAYDAARGVVNLPTQPEPLTDSWLARRGHEPLYRAYVERAPDWQQGRGLAVLGRLDGMVGRITTELGRRVRHELVGATRGWRSSSE